MKSLPAILFFALAQATALAGEITLSGTRWLIDGQPVNAGTRAEGLLMNVRMVNAVFEDRHRPEFDAEANTQEFIAQIPAYVASGVNAFTLCLQGGMPGYEGALNSAFEPDGSLRPEYLRRVERVIEACDQQRAVVILGLLYQRQSKVFKDEDAVRAAVVNAVKWVRGRGFKNVVIEIANEYQHKGFIQDIIRDPEGQASLVKLAKATAPELLISTSGIGNGRIDAVVAEACDFLLPHWNGTKIDDIPGRVEVLKQYGKPVVCNEDEREGLRAVIALRATVKEGCAYGLMLQKHNQHFPFEFHGPDDDPEYYADLRKLAVKTK